MTCQNGNKFLEVLCSTSTTIHLILNAEYLEPIAAFWIWRWILLKLIAWTETYNPYLHHYLNSLYLYIKNCKIVGNSNLLLQHMKQIELKQTKVHPDAVSSGLLEPWKEGTTYGLS